MELDRLRRSPVGRLVEIPIASPDADRTKYWAYVPTPLPDEPQLSMRTIALAGRAAMAVARLDQALLQLPNPQLLVRPAVRQEATSTSALEGTFADLDTVLQSDFLDERDMSAEQREIRNVVAATEAAIELLARQPINRTLIGKLQRMIVRGTPGETYDAGDLRKMQVYIGSRRHRVDQSRFVPCPPGDLLVEGFSDWEKWINRSDDVPVVVRLALGHYQFETLHPYADGNGRLGRLIAMLQLISDGALSAPVLNLSTWLESRRDEYIDGLLDVSCTGDFDPWVRFIATGVQEQADEGVRAIGRLVALRAEIVAGLRAQGVRGSAVQIAESLIGYPVLDVATASELAQVSFQAANTAVSRLVDAGVLREMTGRRTRRLFYCASVLDVINKR